MAFSIAGLDPTQFAPLFGLPDEALAHACAVRVIAPAKPYAPCRISLADAEIGESVLLLSYTHQAAATPYAQQGPIFVREAAPPRFEGVDTIPPAMAVRTLSLRAFDAADMMIEADLTEGANAEGLIVRQFANLEVAYIHAHYARRGCFAARIDRA